MYQGCNGSAIWYALSPNGPVPVGQGPILDALPQTSTCYMVVCCDPLYPACCDTDTVCVYVNELPILQWNTNYPEVCQNSAPIYLDSNNVLVFVNNNWVPVSSLGRQWSILRTICNRKYLHAIHDRHLYYLLYLYR
ncbi:MAG: hypothetical protein IPM91_17350 [Bacteroidetes bacterium]|nr:hypothetical protein [Bacteroidota bacterium]